MSDEEKPIVKNSIVKELRKAPRGVPFNLLVKGAIAPLSQAGRRSRKNGC